MEDWNLLIQKIPARVPTPRFSHAMSTTTLLCKQCNFENEPERVYCHNCGAKLDRSLLPPEATRREDPGVVQERVRKMIKPRGVSPVHRFKNLLASLLVGAILALIVVIARTPGDAPTLSKEAVMDAPTVSDDLEALEQQGGSRALRYTEDQINAFLQSSIRSKDKDATVQFVRAYVHFDEGRCAITTEESIFGLSLFATTVRTVSVQNGTISTRAVGGSFGRLSLPGWLMPYLERVFAPLWTVLDHDRKLVSNLQSITFRRGSVEMVTRAAPSAL